MLLISLFEIILLLICSFEIIEEKDKSTSIYPEPVPWPSLMDVYVSHQHRKPNPPPCPLQSVGLCPSAFDEFNGDCWTSESDDESPDLVGSSSSSASAPASGTSGPEKVSWKMRLDMLVGSGCCVKAKHKAYNLYTLRCDISRFFPRIDRIFPWEALDPFFGAQDERFLEFRSI